MVGLAEKLFIQRIFVNHLRRMKHLLGIILAMFEIFIPSDHISKDPKIPP